MDALTAVNMSQPQLNDLDTVFHHTVDRGLPLLGFSRERAGNPTRDLRGRAHCG